MRELINEIVSARDYENLKDRCGIKLGTLLYKLVDEASRADRELDLVHGCITELYEYDRNVPAIKSCLHAIDQIE